MDVIHQTRVELERVLLLAHAKSEKVREKSILSSTANTHGMYGTL